MVNRFPALTSFFETATEVDFEKLKAGVLESVKPASVDVVRLQDDEALVEKTALIIAGETQWDYPYTVAGREFYRGRGRDVLAMIDELKGRRVYRVTMPKPAADAADAATLRELFNNAPASNIRGSQADEFS